MNTRIRLLSALAATLVLAAGLTPPNAVAGPAHGLAPIARTMPGASSAYAYDITAGRVLLNRRGTVKRILASNAKLYTTAAALDRYGEGERFITALWTDGVIENGELKGNVYLRGGGDPYFGGTGFVKKNFGSGATVEQVALKTSLVGITRITGRVYGDEAVWDNRRGTAKYGFRRSGEIGGQLGALIFNKGLIGGSYQADPPRYAAQKMRAALRSAGVSVKGGTGVGETPAGSRMLAFVESLPLASLARQMNKPSNNYIAEMLLKGLGMPVEAVGGGETTAAGETTAGGAS
ncbi:MAG: D-alanyl-D-alanine carboxypeptidase, partial [Solirubrobacterales bacterium]